MLRRPESFDFDPEPGEKWTILDEEHATNPRDQIEPWAAHVVQTWAMCRGEMGLMHFPDTGGLNDQAAWLMDAFGVCASVESKLREEERRFREGDRER